MKKLINRFENYGINVGRIVGTTEKNHEVRRWEKILNWINRWGDEGDTWCAIDDANMTELGEKLIHTKFDYDEGLKKEHISKVLSILNEETISTRDEGGTSKHNLPEDEAVRKIPKGSVPNLRKPL